MGFFSKTPEEIARKEAEKKAKEERQRQKEFNASPPGRARAAAAAGAKLFQLELTLAQSTAVVVPMMTASTATARHQHANTLDAIEAEGWHLEHADYVFMMTGTESRDKFLASGQQTAVSGEVLGIYIFRRAGQHTT
jgi:hypothetical protein